MGSILLSFLGYCELQVKAGRSCAAFMPDLLAYPCLMHPLHKHIFFKKNKKTEQTGNPFHPDHHLWTDLNRAYLACLHRSRPRAQQMKKTVPELCQYCLAASLQVRDVHTERCMHFEGKWHLNGLGWGIQCTF